MASIDHSLSGYLSAFRRFDSYENLKKSALYREIGPELERTLHSYEHHNATEAVPPNPKPFLRAVAWNIERGIHLDGIIHALRTHPVLKHSDLFFVSETDIGMVRSGNRNVAREIADAMGFNYFFGTSYLNLEKGNGAETDIVGDNTLALHGNALFSRYPIRHAELIPLKNCKNKLKGKEKRLGSQKALLVQIELPGGTDMQAVCVHLDAHSSHKQRVEQMATILDAVERYGNALPVLIGGDWNTSTYDARRALFVFLGFFRRMRHGFSNLIDNHYPYPERWFEKRLFTLVEERGYEYRSLNEIGVGTMHYSIDNDKIHKSLRDWMPEWCIALSRRILAPFGGQVSLKMDWFMGRGIRPVDLACSATYQENAPAPLAPKVIPCPQGATGPLSDHDPIVVDFTV